MRGAGFQRGIHKRVQAGAVFMLEQIIHGCRRVHLQQLRGFRHHQDAFIGL